MEYRIFGSAVLLALAIGLVACNSNARKADRPVETVAANGSMDVDSLLANADNLAGREVMVEALCTHICRHGGAKIFLMGSDDTQTIRCEAGKEMGKFGQECVNSIVRVTGILKEQRIDDAYLDRWKARIKTGTAERHGDSAGGCDSEKKARGEADVDTAEERIANFRQRIAARCEREGKNYLSFYFIQATGYQVTD